jgi:hypothetical protein
MTCKPEGTIGFLKHEVNLKKCSACFTENTGKGKVHPRTGNEGPKGE